MSFAKPRERMNDAIFARLGEDATWSEIDAPVRVILREQDDEWQMDRAVQRVRVRFIRVRRAEIAQPCVGDDIYVEAYDAYYRVVTEPLLLRHLVWQCEVKLQTAPRGE